ncbi:MAG: single-stranded DNA-binding protein, partial [Kiritimatiellae bacterium]|nr:single-stranded DNA-binding protein [Kiritimatiellia bacterium]
MADYIVKTGNLVKDAELRRAGETYVMTFTIAQNKFFKGRKEARYWDCAMWDDASGRVQKLVNYLPKGS